MQRTSSRRQFMTRAAGAGCALGLPAFLPRAVRASPQEKVVVGHVGLGGRGSSLLGQTAGNPGFAVAALCDVDARHLSRARDTAGSQAATAGDYRRLLERKDIDAIVVATPDHWHAPVTIQACRAGKDVYVEKPLCHNVEEGRAMVRAARAHSRIVQVGIHHRSAGYNREIARIIRGGRIGKVHAVKCWMWENPLVPPTPGSAPPAELDWDSWLGPAPEVPYHPKRAHFNFRWCADYAGGYMTDWGVHMLNVVTCAMEIDHQGPESVQATARYALENLYDFPMDMHARWKFRDPDFTLEWIQPSAGGDLLPGQRHGMTFYGEDGELRTAFGNPHHAFYRDGKEAPLPREGKAVAVPESPGHMQNWLDSIRERRLPVADVEIGHRTTSICILGNIAMAFGGQELRWDWRGELFAGAPQANLHLARKPRTPYGA